MRRFYKVTVEGESGKIHYIVLKKKRACFTLAKKVANRAFWGEEVKIAVDEYNEQINFIRRG